MTKIPIQLSNQFILLAISCVLIILAYQFADKSIVLWAHGNNLRQYTAMIGFTYLSKALAIFAFLLYPILLTRFLYHKQTYNDRVLLALANSIAITEFLKSTLKQLFGRFWAATWVNHNPSLLQDGAYGFNWLQGGQIYGSFPSGHVAVMFAAMTVIGIAYPRLRSLTVLLSLGMIIAQVGLYYHFLSDAIAGATLGYLVARNVLLLSEIKWIPRTSRGT